MEGNVCSGCVHFLQHYGMRNNKLYRLYCGHCTAVSVKHRRPDAKACANYARGTAEEEGFVTKEYLSHRLLERVLQMELLPDIHNGNPTTEK